MSTKKEEERNEKIIRGLLKLPPNRRCINCNSLGPQYVCTNFWTFICIACSGVHREFTHRVKSVSMAKFTTQEVEALQRGGNQRARELFLKDWDVLRTKFPDNSNPDKIREFIKSVYIDKRFAGIRSSDKPPRDTQNVKGHEEDHRRASSYHSFSQSPPYDHQYEDRLNGKQAGILTRKPGSDRGHYYEGKISSFMYSPGRLGEQMYEDRFANEGSNSRMSDYSASSPGDPFRSNVQSPNINDPRYSSPYSQVRDIVIEDTQNKKNTSTESFSKGDIEKIPKPHRTASSGSFGSLDSNSMSLKSGNSGSLIDTVLEPEHPSEAGQAEPSSIPSLSQIASAHAANEDLFGLPFTQPSNMAPPIDLFSDSSNLSSLTGTRPSEQKPPVTPLLGNEGWATFDFPRSVESCFEANHAQPSVIPPREEVPSGNIDLYASVHNNSQWVSVQSYTSHGHSSLTGDQWYVGSNEVKDTGDSRNSQSWNAFGDSNGNIPPSSFGMLPQNSKPQVLLHSSPTPDKSYNSLTAPEVPFKDGLLSPVMDDKAFGLNAPPGMAGSSLPSSFLPQVEGTNLERISVNPFDLPYDSDPEVNNMFLDMSSVQAALPDKQLPNTFLGGGLPEPWFPQNSLTTLIPTAPQGGLAYIGGQVSSSQLSNISTQGSVVLGGNPFA